jgi:hypothetical protein
MEKIRIRDPGWQKPGSGVNSSDPQHWFKDAWLDLNIAFVIIIDITTIGYRTGYTMTLNLLDKFNTKITCHRKLLHKLITKARTDSNSE